MRPVVPDSRPPPSPKPSLTDFSSFTDPRHGAAPPETFFLTRDHDNMASSEPDASEGCKESTYGVQSLEETINETTGTSDTQKMDETIESSTDQTLHRDHPALRRIAAATPSRPLNRDLERPSHSPSRSTKNKFPVDIPTSLSLTPSILRSPAEPVSLPSSPKSTSTRSPRPSEDISLFDEAGSQAVASDDDGTPDKQSRLHGSAPQFIMPSIRMPSRRPFTGRGKAMGRVKVLIAGAPGSGKTSLLKAMVQQSEDIVHVDPLPPHPSHPITHKMKRSERKSTGKSRQTRDQPSISEVYASTKPYPSWWSDLEDSRVLRRRKSMGDVVLERNLCFVDNNSLKGSRAEQTEFVVQYIVQQLLRSLSAIHNVNADLQGLLGGNGGSQVDAVLYLASKDTISADIECIQRLAQFSNVIPLISKADTLSQDEISSLKQLFLEKSADAGIQPFLFGGVPPEASGSTKPCAPFAVSSANATDSETMDASVLMSPDYVQPLAPSELEALIEEMFDRDNLAWLRHSAAKKLIQSHHLHGSSTAVPTDSDATLSGMAGSQSVNSSFLASLRSEARGHRSSTTDPSSYTLARITDHTQREEHLAQVRLAKWATDLQKSLQNERKRYETLARDERAVWLTERLGECVVDGTLVPLSETPGFGGFQGSNAGASGGVLTFQGKEGRRVRYRIANTNSQDPLGLIGWNDELRRQGWILVQVVGSVGVVGGLALWMARVWGMSSQSSPDWTMGWLSGST